MQSLLFQYFLTARSLYEACIAILLIWSTDESEVTSKLTSVNDDALLCRKTFYKDTYIPTLGNTRQMSVSRMHTLVGCHFLRIPTQQWISVFGGYSKSLLIYQCNVCHKGRNYSQLSHQDQDWLKMRRAARWLFL